MLFHLFLYLLLSYVPMWLTIYVHRHLKPDPVRDAEKRFAPFICYDYAEWSYLWTLVTHIFFWPRFIGVWLLQFSCVAGSWVIMIGGGSIDKCS